MRESSIVGDMAHKPAYFVPDSMSVWNLLREFRIRKVHMAVVLNEYGGTIGIVTLEDVVEEIVGEIFDENDSKEEIQKKKKLAISSCGLKEYTMLMQTPPLTSSLKISILKCQRTISMRQSLVLSVKHLDIFQGQVRRLRLYWKGEMETDNNYNSTESDRADQNEKNQNFKLEILAGNARKVSAVRFERISDDVEIETNEVTRLVPKIMTRKRKSNGGSDRNNHNDISFMESRDHEDDHSNNFVMAEREDNHDIANKQ
ncbi:DUF21 domain-containing protein At1g55930, chloroplastic-like isoform X2 [Lycium barbarum]|uniref:DUF21 domain-containing protein At1g55930, chloroplastic-like isoform X2 n=2 Tax=Lycium barbarum TaxID=112863 RepID=UPI00293E65B2|nr:DUF21 domain-containing protein At1g55930, chloroplastic-like isoform X2 [Lycium barbarum]